MARLVFDIETSALGPENFDEAQLEYLFRDAEKQPDDTARALKRADIQQQFNLWPFTAQVVTIAMVNADTGRGQVLFQSDDFEDEAIGSSGPVEFAPQVDEQELLTAFWDVARRYDAIVTFNGRGFDIPFLYLRSALLNVPIYPQGLARIPLPDRTPLRSRRATHLLQRQRTRRRSTQVQPRFLLPRLRHPLSKG